MKLSEFVKMLNESKTPLRDDYDLYVVLDSYGNIGGTRASKVSSINFGFDWDHGKLLISTEDTLTAMTPEQLEEVHQSAKKGQSWHAYQSYKKQDEEIKRLRTENEQLKNKIKEIENK